MRRNHLQSRVHRMSACSEELGSIVNKGVQSIVEEIISGQVSGWLFHWVRNKGKERCRKSSEILGWASIFSMKKEAGLSVGSEWGDEIRKIRLVWRFHSFNNIYSILSSTFTILYQPGPEMEFKVLTDARQEEVLERPSEGFEQKLTGCRLKDHPNQAELH